ncbi:ChaC-like protein [Lactarius psammicola]|nr:ChaC-like protein [Lactarius psammicola]
MTINANADGNAAQLGGNDESTYVVFGYGSLIFRPPPHVIKETPGYLKGYVRRFAQKSHDHRGTPTSPGRVVTLVHQEDWAAFSSADSFPHEDVVWGVAFTIDPVHATEVRAYLDYREKDGYTLERVDVHGLLGASEEGHEAAAVVLVRGAECYVGRNDNPSFVGSESLEELADTVWRAVGPSGRNKDYVYNLAAAVRALAPEAYDSHLFALEVRASCAHIFCPHSREQRRTYKNRNSYRPGYASWIARRQAPSVPKRRNDFLFSVESS